MVSKYKELRDEKKGAGAGLTPRRRARGFQNLDGPMTGADGLEYILHVLPQFDRMKNSWLVKTTSAVPCFVNPGREVHASSIVRKIPPKPDHPKVCGIPSKLSEMKAPEETLRISSKDHLPQPLWKKLCWSCVIVMSSQEDRNPVSLPCLLVS